MSEEVIRAVLQGVKDGAIERNFGIELLRKLPGHGRVDQRIAVIGVGCRFPGSRSKEAFWKNLRAGKDCVGPFPQKRRADVDRYLGVFDEHHFLTADPYFHGGYLDEVDEFDNEAFNMLPGECLYVAPEQRIFLETALETFEDAGYGQDALQRSATGVYVGNSGNQYGYLVEDPVPSSVAGNLSAFIASRVSYAFGLSGPSMMVSVGCSSSLLAVHLACQGLLSGDCDMALAGGVTLDLFPSNTKDHIWNMLGIARNEARCRAFDDRADGIAKGEGAGAVLLKPLARALKDGDSIYAVLLASGANQDGRSNGITAPNPLAQADLLERTWRKAGIEPRSLGYVEAHGTGTHLGDPIELKGLDWAFRRFTNDQRFCAIGSVKTNIGHLADGAAGIAGLIKTILAIRHREIPPSLHFQTPNRNVNFETLPVYVNTELRPWPSETGPRRAGVSAFGLCGTNVHVVLEEWNTARGCPVTAVPEPELFVLSARSEAGLRQTVQEHLEFYEGPAGSAVQLRDVCHTLGAGRPHHEHRLALIVEGMPGLRQALAQVLEGWDGARSKHALAPDVARRSTHRLEALEALLDQYLAGGPIDWSSFSPAGSCQKLNLPRSALQRRRFWLEAARLSAPMLGNLQAAAPANAVDPRDARDGKKQPISGSVDTEELRDIWRSCLGVATFSETDSLYRIGGDSLIAVQIASKLTERFGVTLDLQEFFDASSFAEFVGLVSRACSASAESTASTAGTSSAVTVTGEGAERATRSEETAGSVDTTLPLTYAQHRLWVMDQLEAEQVAYLVQGIFQVTGDLDPTRLSSAVEAAANTHDVFRYEIGESGGQPFQRLRADAAIQVERLDLSSVPEPVAAALDLARRRCQTPLPLDRPPLCRFQLTTVGPAHWIFSYQIHHIIFDGWSHHLFFNEVRRRYLNTEGPAATRDDRSRANYSSFVQTQRSAALAKSASEQYWLTTLNGELPKTIIAGDKPRPPAFSYRGRTLRAFFEIEELESMQRCCERENVTLFVLLMSVLNVLVHARSKASDLLIGMPVHGREEARFHETVGLFSNTVVLRQSLEPGMPFRSVLDNVRRDSQLAIHHQRYPFDRLVEELAVRKEPAFSPLFNINLAVQNARSQDKGGFELPLVSLQWEPTDVQSCKWDLAFDFVEFNAGLQLNLEYCSDLYSQEFIEALARDYRAILRAALTSPAQTVELLAPAPQGECHSGVIARWNTVVRRSAAQTALRHGDDSVTYAELDQVSRRVSALLLDRQADEGVGVLCTHGIRTVAAILGALFAGRPYVPLDPESPLERLKAIVARARITTLVYTAESIDVANRLQWECAGVKLSLCCDSDNVFALRDKGRNGLSDAQLWDYFGSKAADDIQGGGWVSSYTGQPFSRQEMAEYADNVWHKVRPFIRDDARILEIGCSSGITLFRVAPRCREYVAIDVSGVILGANRERAAREGLTSKVRFYQMEASEIDGLSERDFDVVIINSVIHCFSGFQYLEDVMEKVLRKCASVAHVFIGDVMDADSKCDMEESLRDFKAKNGDEFPTKLYWDAELFVPRRYFRYLGARFVELRHIDCSRKIHSLENELTRFRYDVVLQVDKSREQEVVAEPLARLDWRDVAAVAPRGAASVQGSSLAYVLHTSGSTGTPKGVGITHDNLACYLDWACREYCGDQPADMAVFTPLTFDFTVTSLFCPLLTGGAGYLWPGAFRASATDIFAAGGPTRAKLTPSHLAYLLETGVDLSAVDMFILGGEALERRLLQRLAAVHRGEFVIYNEYGPTEATVGCIVERLTRSELEGDAPVRIGRPIADMKAFVVDDRRNAVAPGSRGEIMLQGASVAPGYLDGAAADRFLDLPEGRGWAYLTGDLGSVDEEGRFSYWGRKDDQLKILGHRVEPAEVAEALAGLPGVIRAHVLGLRGEGVGVTLAAFLQLDRPLRVRDIRAQLGRVLPAYMLPTVFKSVDSFPTNVNGKVDKVALQAAAKDLEVAEPVSGAETLLPREQLFVDIVREVLRDRVGQISLDVSFADLGGDSIRGIQFVNALTKNDFAVRVSELFELRTLRELMNVVSSRAPSAQREVRGMVGPFELLPLQSRFLTSWSDGAAWFNNSVLLAARVRIDASAMEQAVLGLVRRHELLRAVFLPTQGGGFMGEVLRADESRVAFEVREVANEGSRDALLNELQRGFDLTRGPLFRVALLRSSTADWLYILAHHLIIDRVSWQVLLDDLVQLSSDAHAYERQPRRSVPFGTWAASVNRHFQSREHVDAKFWQGLLDGADERWLALPSRVRDLHVATTRVDRVRSGELAERSMALTGGLETFCATAVARALTAALGGDEVLMMFESHGRHPEQLHQEMDIGQTIGWFTAPYPVKVNADHGRSFDDWTLTECGHRIRDSKRRCLSYGFHREVSGPKRLGFKVGFNYMGDVRGAAGASFRVLEQRGIAMRSPDGVAEHELFVAAALTEEGLTFDVEYDTLRYDAAWIAQLLERVTIEIAGAAERMTRQAAATPQTRDTASADALPPSVEDTIVALTPRGTGLDALFMLHAAGGEVFQYGLLAKELAGDLHVLGVQARGLFGAAPLPRSRAALAEHYADAISAAQPSGAISLCGYSLSSFIGYDVIGKLEERGRNVERFILIDNPIADVARDRETIQRRAHVIVDRALQQLLGLSDNPFASEPTSRMIAQVFGQLPRASRSNLGFDQAFFERYARLVSGLYECVSVWQVDGVRKASLHYIGAGNRQAESENLGGWRPWFGGAKSQATVDCGHTEFFKAPHVSATARAILAAFRQGV